MQRFENYTTAVNITGDARLKALLLHLAGERVHDIYDTLADEGDKYADVKARLETYFTPKKNTQYQVYMFRKAVQLPGENLDTYCTRLRMLAKNCEFADTDKEIKAQLIQSCTSTRLRRRALREPDKGLDDLLDHGRSLELSEQQAAGMEQTDTASVNVIQQNWRPSQYTGRGKPSNNCRNCGGQYPHEGDCPARGKDCKACGRMNHFARQCRSRQQEPTRGREPKDEEREKGKQHRRKVYNVTSTEQNGGYNSSSSDEKYVFIINSNSGNMQPQTCIKLNGTKISALIDSGAAVNIISESVFNTMTPRPQLTTVSVKIYPYGCTNSLPIAGAFNCDIEAGNKKTKGVFYVLEGDGCSLLSYQTADELGLIKIVNSVSSTSGRTVADELVDSYPELFQGIGKLKDFQVKLHINKDVQPTCQPHRRVPFHIRKKVEDELLKLENDDIIETVTGPTPWVSPIVTPPKPKDPDKVRICVDMRQANTAIQRERHITPTMDDVIHELNGATVFSKLDLAAGYHQLELHPASRYITTFTTHQGLRRYKRLNFGISSAAEVFQNAICQTLQGISGVKNLSDDIIIHGKTQAEHDDTLRAVFQRLKERGLTLNRKKCEFDKSSLEFFGFIFSADGISADPKKVAAIKQASDPQDPTEVRSLLGMANYCARFIPDFATISALLRELTKKDTQWSWGPEHAAALQTIKDSLTSDTVMAYFDPAKDTELIVDASPVGLGAILYQSDRKGERHTIAYASRAE